MPVRAVWLLLGCNERGGQGEVSEDLRSRAAALHREDDWVAFTTPI